MFAPFGVLDFLDSREDALLFWIVVAAGVSLYKIPGLRSPVVNIIRALLAPKLLILWVAIAGYTAVVVLLAERAGWWHTASFKETAYWFFGTGLVLTGRATQTRGDPAQFKRLLLGALKLTIFLEFFINVWVFPFAVELVFIPLMALLVSLNVVAERDPKFAAANKVIERILLFIGVVVLTFVAISAVTDVDFVLSHEMVEQLLVAPALTLASVPLLYLVAVWSTYEMLFARVGIFIDDKRLARRANWAIAATCQLSLRRIGRFHGRFFVMLRAVRNDADMTDLMREFETALRADAT